MKITKLESIPLAIPFVHGGKDGGFRGQDWSKIYTVLLRVETADGVTGWGEAFGYGTWKAVKGILDELITPLVLDREVDDIGTFMCDIAQMLHIFGRNGTIQYAMSGLDIALWDIKAKLAGLPLHKILGNASRAILPAYSSLFKYGEPATVARMARRSLDEGFKQIKLHETGLREIEAARESVGPETPIMVDVNCPWTPHQAVEAAKAMRQHDIFWLEEPIFPPEDFKSLAECQKHGGIKIGAGENVCGVSDFEKMLDAGAVSFAQPSVAKLGGISTFLVVDALCRERGIPVYPHSAYFGPGLLATLQLIAARPDATLVEWFKLELEADLFDGKATPTDGSFIVPTSPGLGYDPEPAVISAYRVPT